VLSLYAVSAGLAMVWPSIGVNPKAPSNATYTARLVLVTDTQVASEFDVATLAWAAVGPVPASSWPPTRVKAEAHPVAVDEPVDGSVGAAYEDFIARMLRGPLPGRVRGDAAKCIRRVPCSMNTSTYSLFTNTVSMCRKSNTRTPGRLGVQELPPGRARALRTGPTPAVRRTS